MKCAHCKQNIKIKDIKDSLTCPYCQKKTFILTCVHCESRFISKQFRSPYTCKKCKEKQSLCPEPASEQQSIEKRAVFISYAHEDKAWLTTIKKYLDFYKNEGLTVWTDQELRAGDQWNTEIETAITHASIAILLISIDFFNSSFIMDKEMPCIQKQCNNNSMRVIPIIVSQCPWDKNAWIKQLQVRPDEALPLDQCKKISEVLTSFADEIFQLVQSQPLEKKSKSFGSASVLMCNRIPQLRSFLTNYHVHKMPQFYFIHGREQDQHNSLVTRYNQTIIHKRIQEIYDVSEKPYMCEYVFKEYGKKSDDQQNTLLYDIGIELTGESMHDITSFEKLVNATIFEQQNAIIISHKIEEDFFHKDLLTWYIQEFWTKGCANYLKKYKHERIPQFILFFNIIYEAGFLNKLTHRKKKMIRWINEITPKNSTFVLIPELEPVIRPDVQSWFNTYTSDLKDCPHYESKRNECIKQLFPNPKGSRPMAVVEEKLVGFSRQF
jgi:predicted RNA-binding Zn-ribbon protein involved in translation (DUF1610 family)